MGVACATMSSSPLSSLFGHKAWANQELYAAVAALPAEHAAVQTGCIRTLNHIYVVDRLFRARLAGEALPFEATNTRETPALAQLAAEVRATDGWYVEHVAALTPAQLAQPLSFTFTDGDAGRMTREEILLHVITHGGYHRGNVGQMLRSVGVNPPRDLYTRFLHTLQPERRAAAP